MIIITAELSIVQKLILIPQMSAAFVVGSFGRNSILKNTNPNIQLKILFTISSLIAVCWYLMISFSSYSFLPHWFSMNDIFGFSNSVIFPSVGIDLALLLYKE